MQVPQTPSRLHLNPPSHPESTPVPSTPRLKLRPPVAPKQKAGKQKPLEQTTPPRENHGSKKSRYIEDHPGFFDRTTMQAMFDGSSLIPPAPPSSSFFSSQTDDLEDMSLREFLNRRVPPLVPQAKQALSLLSPDPPRFQGISEDSDLEESQVDSGIGLRRSEEDEEEDERRRAMRNERGEDRASNRLPSTAVSQVDSQKKKTPDTNKSRGGRTHSEMAAPSSSSTKGAGDGLTRPAPSQITNEESRMESPLGSFNFELYTRAFWEKDVSTNIIFAGSELHSFSGDKDLSITKHHAKISEDAGIYALKRDLPSYLVSVLAIPSHGKLPKSKQQGVLAKDSTQWGSVLLTLQRWSEDGFIQLKVDLIYHFARNPTGELPPVSKAGQPVSKAVITGSTIPVQSSHIPTTNQLLQREAAHTVSPGEAEFEALLAKWACNSHICPNKGFYCYVDKVDGKHLKLDAMTAKQWNTLISSDPSGRLSDNEPPDQIRRKLQKMYENERKNEKKQASKGLPFSGMPPPAWAASTGPLTYSPYQLPYQLGPYPLPPPPPLPITSSPTTHLSSIRTSALKAELANRGVEGTERQSRSRSSSTRRRSRSSTSYTPYPEQRSSPVEANLDEYIKWMKKRNKTFAADYEKAYEILLDQGYTTDTIQPWKTEEKWKELGIKAGIGLQLAGNISKWGRERAVSQPDHPVFPKRSEQEQSLLSPYTDARQGRFRPSKGRIIPSIEQDGGEGIRADSASDGENYAGDLDLDDLDWQDDSQATQ